MLARLRSQITALSRFPEKYSKQNKRIDVRHRWRAGAFYYVVKAQIQSWLLKIRPQYRRITTLVLDRNSKGEFAI